MLDRFQKNIGEILTAAADAPAGAVAFHCHSGKDRTGLIAALTLELVGVADTDIAADYALSDRYLAVRYSEMLAEKTDPEERARLAEQLTSKPEAILGALLHLKERYGGVDLYLEACELNQRTRQKLRERMLEPV